MNWKSAVPNSFTLGNLLCGCLGIIATFESSMLWASFFVAVAAVLDFFDGLVARLMGISGELGKQLDSLADVLTFGVLPGIMMYHWISIGFGDYFTPFLERPFHRQVLAGTGLLVALFSAVRLAVFNIDTRQADYFIGVPTPANAILIASFPLVMHLQYDLNFYSPVTSATEFSALIQLHFWQEFDYRIVKLLWNPYFHIVFSAVSAFLLVAPVPMLHFKIKSLGFAENKHRYIFLILMLILAVTLLLPYISVFRRMGFPFFDYLVIPFAVLLYITYSLILFIIKKAKNEV